MLEFGQSTDAPVGNLVIDVTEATFMKEVVEASQEIPIVVDFWAPWCGPCKTLGPQLEAAVAAQKGKVKMVKVDVDQNQQIAAQLRIQSVPTVYAFWQGQPLDAFQGAVSPGEVVAFVEKLAGLAGDGGLAEAVEAAEAMLEDGSAADAAQTFSAILEEEPENATAFGGLVRSHLAMAELDQAEALLSAVPDKIKTSAEVESARAQLELARQAEGAGPLAELSAAVAADPENHKARFDYALALHASGDVQGAVDQLLDLFRRDREWNDGAAKIQLFTIFDALKPQDSIVLTGRRKLSSMIFA
ncbi:MAG: putative thioredoxin [Paracoccaceae bacterium]|jgi:putative thioredoxin